MKILICFIKKQCSLMFRSPTKKDFQYIAEFLFRQVWAFYVFVIIFFHFFFLHIFLHTIYNTAPVHMAPVRWTPTLRLERKPQTKNLSLFLNRICLFTAVLMPNFFIWLSKFTDVFYFTRGMFQFGYPFAISKNALAAVGSPHTWPSLLVLSLRESVAK